MYPVELQPNRYSCAFEDWRLFQTFNGDLLKRLAMTRAFHSLSCASCFFLKSQSLLVYIIHPTLVSLCLFAMLTSRIGRSQTKHTISQFQMQQPCIGGASNGLPAPVG
jgi:hypothetical protein